MLISFPITLNKMYVLGNGYKLKDTDCSVSEDFSATVRFERKRLLGFAKSLDSRFKLSFYKLTISNRTCLWPHQEVSKKKNSTNTANRKRRSDVASCEIDMLAINCRSIKNKVDDLTNLVLTARLGICCVSS